MNDSKKLTIARYQSFLEATALSASLDAAIEAGIFDALRDGQKNLTELAEACACAPEALSTLLRVLVAIGAVEKYEDDFALSQAAQLLAGPDIDMGRGVWYGMASFLAGEEREADAVPFYRRRVSNRQWSHTAAAVQAAEVLDIGHAIRGLNVLELGGGAGVWSAAMAYRDPQMHVTVVDTAARLAQCQATFASIDLLDRWTPIEDDYRTWSTPLDEFDLVILPEVLQLEDDAAAVILLGRSADALREGGQVVIVETLREADGPSVPLATQALEIAVAARGRQRSASEIQQLLRGAGFGEGKWGWLTASSSGLGLITATKL
jgi:2-polyprenyl-3-methyl-5-hydroxy-6-metoxy-1,4-benzoquinol methylase